MGCSVFSYPPRLRPVVWCLFLFFVVFWCIDPAAAATACTLTKNDCPVCPASGLSLTDSSVFNNDYLAGVETSAVFSGLTCNYGNPLSGNTVSIKIECYQDAGVAEKWYRYHKREIPYPYPDSQYAPANPGSSYWESPVSHRVSPVANWGGDTTKSSTFKSAYQDWDFALAGRYEAEITSTTPTDTMTQKEASAVNVKRIQQVTDCFASFSPGSAPAPAQKVIKGTITGSGFTQELYQDFQAAMDDAVFRDSPEKIIALTERKNIDFFRAKPLRHVKITWKGSQEAGAQDKEYITSTDANGNFEIPADLTPGKQYQFIIEFTYRKGNTDFFSVSEATAYNVATYPHTFEYTGEKDLRQDVNFITELKTMNDEAYEAGLSSTLTLYDETANALEFYQDHLGENLDCNLPLSVYPFWNDRRSKFEIDSGRGNGKPSPAIVITPADSSFAIPFQSQYVVYHEFSHYAMYCIYDKKFPVSAADNGPVKTINHGGYMNPSTSDSFTEGFAEFMPAIIQEYYGSPLAGRSGGMGSLDDTFKAWDYEGKAEEHAISATLWNIYNTDSHYDTRRKSEENIRRDILNDPAKIAFEADREQITVAEYRDKLTREIGLLQSGQNLFDEDHPVKLRFDQIWPVLRTYNRDFTDVYAGLVSTYPDQKAGIDTVFVEHGLYRDTQRGNGSYDPGEPWRPATGDRKTYASGDPYIDLPRSFTFTGSETVGSAADYQRTTRRSSEPLPGHFIRTTVDVPVYVVSVEYADRPWMSYRTLVYGENNMVPIPVPPPGEDAGVTVLPVGVKYEKPLYFRSEDFNRDFSAAASRGYYVEHDFKVSGPIPPRTVVKTGGTSGSRSSTGTAITTPGKAGFDTARGLLVPAVAFVVIFFFVKRRQ